VSLYRVPVRSLILVHSHQTATGFAAATRIATDLVLRPEVEQRWADESACAGMTVGALARHLVSQWDSAVRLLAAPPGAAPITVWEHYERAAWRHTSLDDEANAGIRDGSGGLAAEGPDAMRALVEELARQLDAALDAEHEGSVLVPWQGWSLSADDFLLTRMMEVVVHADDLAASVGLETPDFPPEVTDPVLALLTGLARRRHGATAVVRALTRPQRAPATVTAF
jgi:hypothetical protein